MKFDSADKVIASDLDTITETAAAEFGELSGGHVLVTGGGGFLGHYLVRAALHWNKKNSQTAHSCDGV